LKNAGPPLARRPGHSDEEVGDLQILKAQSNNPLLLESVL